MCAMNRKGIIGTAVPSLNGRGGIQPPICAAMAGVDLQWLFSAGWLAAADGQLGQHPDIQQALISWNRHKRMVGELVGGIS